MAILLFEIQRAYPDDLLNFFASVSSVIDCFNHSFFLKYLWLGYSYIIEISIHEIIDNLRQRCDPIVFFNTPPSSLDIAESSNYFEFGKDKIILKILMEYATW